jgi:hypothetical protein
LENAVVTAHAERCHSQGKRFKYTPLEANWFMLTERQNAIRAKLMWRPEYLEAVRRHDDALKKMGVETLSELVALYPLRSTRRIQRFD